MTDQDLSKGRGRTERKRRAVLDAATALFLRNGFRGTSMDEVAATAHVSKQTVYKQFRDKESLFREIIEGVSDNAEKVSLTLRRAFGDAPATTAAGLEERLAAVARAYLDAVLDPRVLALRRLIIAEADAFPDLARRYFERAPEVGITIVAEQLAPYARAGLLSVPDADIDPDGLRTAAAHFAYLVLGPAQDRAVFLPHDATGPAERDRLAASAAGAFLHGYLGD